jgi:hypothetical protein
MNTKTLPTPILRYVGFDTKTGQIIHTHTRFSVPENRYVEVPVEELKTRFAHEPFVLSKLSDQDPKNLDFIAVETSDADLDRAPLMVDPTKRKLVPRPSLRLTAKKSQLTGDGQDSTEIEVSALDGHGKHQSSAKGKIKVSTTRGKLSARGGIVDLKGGRATITLTSVGETVNNVRLVATALDHPYTSGQLDVEFV